MKEDHLEKGHLKADQVRILDRYLIEYKHQGYELPERKYFELQGTWMKRLYEAKRDYSYRMMVKIGLYWP